MDNRQRLSNKAQETLDFFKRGFYNTRRGMIRIKDWQLNTVQNTVLYSPEDTERLLSNIGIHGKTPAILEVTTESTLEASKRLVEEGFENVVCLNFASAKKPGGGFLTGSVAQEESLARASGLYPSLITKKEMYDFNIKNGSALYSDFMIYSPKVPVIRDDDLNLLDVPYRVSMITSPAVNRGAIQNSEEIKQIESVMKKRIEKILAVAIEQGNEAIVLGSFGCGVFRNSPQDVARYFKEVLYTKGYAKGFKKIIFGIYGGGENYDAFKKILENKNGLN